jgi:hypothetical protein
MFGNLKMTTKSVKFNDITTIEYTYSKAEYDRFPIDSVIYRKGYNEIPEFQWRKIITNLHDFKHKMPVHIDSL